MKTVLCLLPHLSHRPLVPFEEQMYYIHLGAAVEKAPKLVFVHVHILFNDDIFMFS